MNHGWAGTQALRLEPCRLNLAGFLHCEYFAVLVVPALRAGAVRLLQFVAVRALGESGAGDAVVRAPGCGAPFRMSPFRVCHFKNPISYEFKLA